MFNNIQDVEFWCKKILPTVYDDSLSYLQAIGRLKKIVNEMIQAINMLGKSNTELTERYEETMVELAKLQKTIDDFVKGYTIADGSVSLDKLGKDVMKAIEKLVIDTVYSVAKFVWFGLDDEGYFIAIIPDSWKDIVFDTSEEGNLILEY